MTPTLLTPPVDTASIEAATRRQFLTLLGATGLLTGCAVTEPGTAPNAETREYRHPGGLTTIPVRPQRIVTMHSTTLAWPLATLGVRPVATHVAPADDPVVYIESADAGAATFLAGMEGLGDAGDVNLERIAALAPDLIIGTPGYPDDAQYRLLSAIAPTVLVDPDADGGDFFAVQRQLADLTGTLPQLTELHAGLDRRIEALRGAHPEMWPALTWAYFDEYVAGGPPYLGNLTPAGCGFRVLDALGARLAPGVVAVAPAGEPGTELSLELVPGIDADVVFATPPYDALATDPDTPVTDALRSGLASTAAGRNDQIFAVGLHWANANVATALLVVEDLERFLADRGSPFITS